MLSSIRRLAQSCRHNRWLSFLGPIWPVVRKPYLGIMNTFGKRNGIAVEIGGYEMRLHPSFCTLSWETIEVKSFRAFVDALCPGDVVFDVGAAIGAYTLLALKKTGSSGRVVAYEPLDFARQHLASHLRWNGGETRTTIRDVCCGASSGTADFYYVPGEAEGMSGLVPVEGFHKREVKVVTLDEEIINLGIVPNLLKIDVEGAELDVLKGAEKLLKEKHPILLVSLHPRALAKRGESPDAVIHWLNGRGFKHEIVAADHEIHVLARPDESTGKQ